MEDQRLNVLHLYIKFNWGNYYNSFEVSTVTHFIINIK